MPPATQARCVYCGYKGAKPRRGVWTCHACRDLPEAERRYDVEVETLIARYYEGRV